MAQILEIPLPKETQLKALEEEYYRKCTAWDAALKTHNKNDPDSYASYIKACSDKNRAWHNWYRFKNSMPQ